MAEPPSIPQLKNLMLDASTGFYKIRRYNLGDFFGPVDLGLHLAHKYNSLNIGTGMFAASSTSALQNS